MPEEITRESGVTLTRDSRNPSILYARYNSDNLKNVTGTIRPDGDGWRVSVDLPFPPNRPLIREDVSALSFTRGKTCTAPAR